MELLLLKTLQVVKAQSSGFSVNGDVTCFTLELFAYMVTCTVMEQSVIKRIPVCIFCFVCEISLDELSNFHRVFSFLFPPQIFAIFAFSTCGSYSGMFKMSVECENRSESDLGIEVEFEYPFRYILCLFTSPPL